MLSRPVYALEDNHISNTVNTISEDFEKDHVNVFDNQYESFNEGEISYEDNSLRE